ncbi:MAG: C39 family peptidase [Bacilli bacterium]|nr:C39 family peptidase [Bacilli bacterium]MDD4387806.1 C39 family peptidase [Bacilli bacterium]
MNKRFYLFLFFVLLFSSGCRNITSIYDIDHIADLIVEEINLPNQTSENLNFKSTYHINGLDVKVEWIPSNEAVINANGAITKALTVQEISLEIMVKINEDRATRYLGTVKVLPLNQTEILEILKSKINLPEAANDYLDFPEEVEITGTKATLSWYSSNENIITDEGIINFKEFDQYVGFEVVVKAGNDEYRLTWGEIKVPGRSNQEHISFVIDKIDIPESIKNDFDLPYSLYNVLIYWASSDPNIITIDSIKRKAIWHFNDSNQKITISAVFLYNNTVIEKSYPISVLTIPPEERIQLVFDCINLPETVNSSVNLPTKFAYGVIGGWASSNPDIINSNGIVTLSEKEHVIVLTLKLYSGEFYMSKDYFVTTEKLSENEKHISNHFFIDYAENINLTNSTNLIKEDNKIVLKPHATQGIYESSIYRTNPFNSLVGSWAAVSNPKATVELKIRVRVNGNWSSYLTYGNWGLGLNNAMIPNQAGGVANMDYDEIRINNKQTADAFQYTVILKRQTINDDSPALSLVAAALEMPNYNYPVDVSALPKKVDYNVPQLNQNIVPDIGNQICSPTSSTMLLMYKGHQFSGKYPHAEIAKLFKDYGNNIYGNWVYNTAGMGAYGEKSYVKRIYSWEELQYHLATVGPVALSIRGDTGRYTTKGHLLVVRGYEITDQGTKVICNDPNIKEIYIKYDLSIFLGFTRNIIYVIE